MTAHIHLIAPAAPPAPFPGLRGEADHRIANSLASISGIVRMAARHGDFQDPARFLLGVADRIESVAALHRYVAHSPSGNVRPGCFIQGVCTRLRDALTDNVLTLNFDFGDDRELPADMVLPLGLIALELLSNSIKYAHPAATPLKVSITGARTPTHFLFGYEDDGVGFPEGFDVSHSGNLGMHYLAALSQKLECAPTWRNDELGVQFSLSIPI